MNVFDTIKKKILIPSFTYLILVEKYT